MGRATERLGAPPPPGASENRLLGSSRPRFPTTGGAPFHHAACLPASRKGPSLRLRCSPGLGGPLPPSQVVVQEPLHAGWGGFTCKKPHTWGALPGPAGAAGTPSDEEVTVTARVINGRKLYNSLNLSFCQETSSFVNR